MELLRGLPGLKPRHRGCVASIGNYDGVHLGHQAVLRQLRSRAAERGLPAVVVVFEPMPQEFLSATPPARLMRFREKWQALQSCGLDRVLCLHFGPALAGMAAEEFIRRVLVEGLGVRHLVVGRDFRFGQGRRGDSAMLEKAGTAGGFDVEAAETFVLDGERVSSTGIRAALAAGELQTAGKLLGRAFSLSGRVMHGERLGRKLGFPTANIALRRRVAPVSGIFAARVHGADGMPRYSAAYVGTRPAVSGGQARLEVFLLDFDGALYGRHLQVELLQRLRKDAPFISLEALREQIGHDVNAVRAWLRSQNLY